MRDRLLFSVGEVSVRNTAVILLADAEKEVLLVGRNSGLTSRCVVNRLRERIDGLVILRIILLSLGCLMPDLISPGIKGCSP